MVMLPFTPRPVKSMAPRCTRLCRFSQAARPPVASTQWSRTVSALGMASSAENKGRLATTRARASLLMEILQLLFQGSAGGAATPDSLGPQFRMLWFHQRDAPIERSLRLLDARGGMTPWQQWVQRPRSLW